MKSIVECTTSAEYVASLVDTRASVPVLRDESGDASVRFALGESRRGAPYERTRSLEALTGKRDREWLALLVEMANASAGADAPVCAVVHEDALAFVGAAHAVLAKKRLVVLESLGALAEDRALAGAPSLTLVASPIRISTRGSDHVRADVARRGVARFGILTGSTPARLSNLVARLALRAPVLERSGVIHRMDEGASIALSSLAHEVLPPRPSEAMRRLAREGTALAVFAGHGRSYCAMAGNLCSLTEKAEPGDARCVRDYQCVFASSPRTPARDLRAEVVLSDSCSTASFRLLGPERDVGMNLAVHMLDGFATGVISPTLTNVALSISPYLAWDLLDRGATLGEVTARLDALATARLGFFPPYLLLGDPEMRLFAGEARAVLPATRASIVSRAEDTWTARVAIVPGRVVTYVCEDPELARAVRRGVVHAVVEPALAEIAMLEVLPASGDAHRVEILATWSEDAPARETEITLSARAPFRTSVAEMIARVADNARFEARWLGDTARVELDEHLLAIENPVATSLGLPVADSTQFAALYRVEQETIALCDRVGREMLEKILAISTARSLWLYNHYAGVQGVRSRGERRCAEPCSQCGCAVNERPYDVGLWPARSRHLLECEQCMFLYDVEDGAAPLLLEGPNAAHLNEPFVLRMRVKNTAAIPALVHAAVTVDRIGNPAEAFSIEPRTRDAWLEPGEETELAFTVTISDPAAPHMFHAKGVVLSNGSLAWSMRKISIRRAGCSR